MSGDLSILKIDNLIRLFKRGDISKLYEKMYATADRIAAYEMEKYITNKFKDVLKKEVSHDKANDQIDNYRKQRTKFHLNQMYRLIELHSKKKD